MIVYNVLEGLLILGLALHTLALSLRVKALEGDEEHYGGGRK